MFFWGVEASQTIYFPMIDTNGNEVAGLGSGLTIQLVKPGTTAYITLSGTQGEVGNGIYYYTNDTSDASLAGMGLLKITGSGVVQQNIGVHIGAGFVWTSPTRTLTPPSVTVTSTVTGAVITVYRGVTWVIALSNLGDISDRDKLWFTVKRRENDYDNQALVQIELTGGLLYLNSDVAATSGQGSIAVDDQVDGDITITLDEAASALLPTGQNLHYDVKVLRTTEAVDLLADGNEKFNISADITRAIV